MEAAEPGLQLKHFWIIFKKETHQISCMIGQKTAYWYCGVERGRVAENDTFLYLIMLSFFFSHPR